jgi:hypothetical protein
MSVECLKHKNEGAIADVLSLVAQGGPSPGHGAILVWCDGAWGDGPVLSRRTRTQPINEPVREIVMATFAKAAPVATPGLAGSRPLMGSVKS